MSDTAVLMIAIAGLWLLAATGADAAIVWGVVIGFGAILTGACLTTRKPKH